jgi:hypothetical protein
MWGEYKDAKEEKNNTLLYVVPVYVYYCCMCMGGEQGLDPVTNLNEEYSDLW